MSREAFGIIDKLPSGRYRARYPHPMPSKPRERISAATTFSTKAAARAWLAKRQAEIAAGTWRSPEEVEAERVAASRDAERRSVTLGDYAAKWIATRTNARGEPLRIKTVEAYERLLRPAGTRNHRDREGRGGPLAPLVGEMIGDITPALVRAWRATEMDRGTLTQTSRAYDLLKSILKTAVEDELIERNPCTVKGGSTTSTGKRVEPPTDDELTTILAAIRPEYRALVVLAAAGGLRFGEATELRAKDVTVERDDVGGVDAVRISVSRQVVYTKKNGREEGEVKSLASVRTVAVFGRDAEIIAAQVHDRIGDALVTTNVDGTGWLPQSSLYRHWDRARKAAGRPDLPFHALRHYAGTRYAQTGATVAETMARLGHSSTKAAMRYQHSGNRDDELARRMARP